MFQKDPAYAYEPAQEPADWSYVPTPVNVTPLPRPTQDTAPSNVWNWLTDIDKVWPDAPRTLHDLGVSPSFLEDLILKHLHYAGVLTTEGICHRTGVAFEIIDETLAQLRAEYFLDIASGSGYGEMSYRFRLTERGEQRAMDALSRSGYASVAPVTLDQYVAVVRSQSIRETPPSPGRIREALSEFVITDATRESLSRALHSGRATLIFGRSGNGKTAIIEAYARHADDTVLIPNALYVHGQLIRIYDPAIHTRVDDPEPAPYTDGIFKSSAVNNRKDQRWVRVRRPVVVVGGELTQESLELAYDPIAKFYQAPPHLKAQDGVFVIDDFGRQRVRPEELLNRWIVPMERGSDVLTLHSGESFTVPFEIALMFSTNLSPADLVDEAFLRRIPYKVELPSPDPDQFKEITRRVCSGKRLGFSEDDLEYLTGRLFDPSFPFVPRGAYPRDLVQIILDSARYNGTQPWLSRDLVEHAISVYFLS